jgi:tetratricopeptide (TPR) repeat protein
LPVAVAILLLAAQRAAACGPFFPNTIIDQGDHRLLGAPEGRFFGMAAGLAPSGTEPLRAHKPEDCDDRHRPTAEADLADLRAALAQQKLPAEKIATVARQYDAARQTLLAFAGELDTARRRAARAEPNSPKLPVLGDVAIPQGLPIEFEQYFRGAVLYYQGKGAEARKCWQAVLDLPPQQSRYRATWAAYMIARSECDTDPASAVRHFPKVRELAKEGFRDSMGLAAASYGWQGRAELAQGHYEQAVELYLLQHRSGDGTALASLQYTCGAILKDKPDILRRVSKHDASRQLVTAYIVSKGGPFAPVPGRAVGLAWLGAVESAGLNDVRDADKLAWAAYAAGEFKLARRWVDRSRKDAPIACWVESKLLLRAGKFDEAARKLAQAVEALPRAAGPWQMEGDAARADATSDRYYADSATAAGELATLKLHRCQYVDALDLLYRNGWWTDAALVAERVLTLEELAQYVDKNWPLPLASQEDRRAERARNKSMPVEPLPPPVGNLRHLLARGLVRAGQLQRAARYMPAKYQKALDEYARQLATSNDRKQPQGQRAVALWRAAQALRANGMELMGYELEPDAAVWDGSYEYGMADSRLQGCMDSLRVDGKWISKRVEQKVAPVSADEKKRLAQSEAQPNKRFHYRYKAADLAWQAAQMMPDESDQTALVLCDAGTWLKIRDPKAADRFYKALVRRCGQTSLGRSASSVRWFPDLPAATQPTE